MKISIKREQNQASLSFAERLRVGELCSGMRKKFRPKVKHKRLLLLLALLMTAATGAWAQTSDKETPLTLQATAEGQIYIADPKVGMKYKVGDGDKQTITSTNYVYINVTAGQTVQFFGNGTSITAYGDEHASNNTHFGSNVKCYIYGNIMSLVNEDGFAGATDLTGDYAFQLLFSYFSNLSNHASRKLVLPAMTMTKECYYGMFFGCNGLTEAPALPAPELAEGCYESMFYNCSSLTAAPELPATTLKKKCYYGMFDGCTSLTTAPLLPAQELAQQCYNWMFDGCTSLNAVTCLATNISAQGATSNWLNDVAATGTLTIAKGMEDKWTPNSASGIPTGWSTDVYGYKVKLADGTADAGNWTATVGTSTTAEPLPVGGLSKGDAVTLTYGGRLKVKAVTATTDAEPDPLATPLTIEAITPGTILVNIDGELTLGMKYSKDGGTTKNPITSTTDITVAKGDKVQFYGNGTQTQAYYIPFFVSVTINGSGEGFQTKVYGNIMSLLDEEGFATKTELPNEYVFAGLFSDNLTLSDASELLLPATELTPYCYASMFQGCQTLTAAPKLPATTLATSCYEAMFLGCTSLTTAPKLPATTLADACYGGMFYLCSSLTNAYVKAAYKDMECDQMFTGCTATGATLHTTSDNKVSWETKMGLNKDWETWTVADDWQD